MYRLHQPEPQPEPIKEILARLFAARGWGRRQARLHLERAWAAVVPAEHLILTRVLGLRRGVLEVEVANAALLQELAHFHKRRLVEALKSQLPGQTLNDLRLRAGSWDREDHYDRKNA
jgi:predicted nucleic acid-binding Zn ribbon protein